MADIKINVKTDGGEETLNTLSGIRKQIKDLKSQALEIGEGGKGFKELTQQANELQDKLDDLKDSSKSLQGTGIEKLQSSFGLLTDSFKNADFGKAKIAFQGLGSAMKAIPIFLIVEGIQYLIENFEELSKGSGFLGKAFRAIGDIIQYVIDLVYKFTDAIGLTNSAMDKQAESMVKNAEKAKTAIEDQTLAYDQQIAAAKASGKNAVDLEIAKQKYIIETNKALVEQTIAYVSQGGILTEEQKKLLTEQLKSIKAASEKIQVIEAGVTKTNKDNTIKSAEEIADLKIALEDDLRKKELLIQEKKFKENLKKAHGNAEALRLVHEQNNLAISNINAKYDKIEADRLKADLDAQEDEEEAASEYLANLDAQAAAAKQEVLDYEVEQKKKAEAEKLNASLERYRDEIKAEELKNKRINDASKIFTDSIVGGFERLGGNAGKLGSAIVQNLGNAFQVINDKSASTIEKVSAGLNALGSILAAAAEYQNKVAEEKVKQNEEDTDNLLSNLEAQRDAELSNEQLTSEQKDAIQAKYAQKEYELKLLEYNRNTEVKKKAFEQDKKLRIAQAVISTITGVVSAVTGMIQAVPGPVGIVLGALAGAAVAAMGAIQVAQISKQKFDAGSPPQAPSLQPPSAAGAGGNVEGSGSRQGPKLYGIGGGDYNTGLASQEGGGQGFRQAQPIKAYVVSQEVTSSQNMNATIERRSSF